MNIQAIDTASGLDLEKSIRDGQGIQPDRPSGPAGCLQTPGLRKIGPVFSEAAQFSSLDFPAATFGFIVDITVFRREMSAAKK